MTTIGRKVITLKEIPRAMQERFHAISLVCPLCSAAMPARGFRPQPDPGLPVERWEIIFTCPACGLISSFDLGDFAPNFLKNVQGTQWAMELRQYYAQTQNEEVAYEREANFHHFLAVFIVSLMVWLILTGSANIIDLAWGVIVSLVSARLTYRMVAFDIPKWIRSPRRWLAFIALLFEFVRQLIQQNISLSIRVLKPSLPIRPGIVAVPTRLRDEVSLTILGSLMTLTPDTVTMDIDEKNGLIYVHWIYVQASAPEEVRRMLSADFEDLITRWLE